MSEKRFLVKDQSGRGIAATLPLADVFERWEMEYRNDPENDLEMSFGEWLESAEIGDSYENQDENVVFTRVD